MFQSSLVSFAAADLWLAHTQLLEVLLNRDEVSLGFDAYDAYTMQPALYGGMKEYITCVNAMLWV